MMSKIDFKNIKLPAIKNLNAVLASDHIPSMTSIEVREEMILLEINIIERLNQNKDE